MNKAGSYGDLIDKIALHAVVVVVEPPQLYASLEYLDQISAVEDDDTELSAVFLVIFNVQRVKLRKNSGTS